MLAAEWQVPIAWNLADGYQRNDDGGIGPVLKIHRNTMRECISHFAGRDADPRPAPASEMAATVSRADGDCT